MDPVAELIGILAKVREVIVAVPQDLSWQSSYSSESDLLRDLDDHTDRLRHARRDRLPDLSILFAPTGSLCEIASSSGWLREYQVLADRLDQVLARVRES